jgi:hypothetical protein
MRFPTQRRTGVPYVLSLSSTIGAFEYDGASKLLAHSPAIAQIMSHSRDLIYSPSEYIPMQEGQFEKIKRALLGEQRPFFLG